MFSRKFALEEGKPERLEISLGKTNRVKLDGKEIISVNGDALKNGVQFSLDDGSIINIQQVRSNLFPELHVLRNGKPLPGSDSDPLTKLKASYFVIFVIAGLNFLGGLIIAFFDAATAGLVMLGGFINVFLGYMVIHRSKPALGAAMVLTGIWMISTLTPGMWQLSISGVVFEIIMARGFGAIDELERGKTMVDAGIGETTLHGSSDVDQNMVVK